jgi:fructose-1,6-bisphosphatase/inositol monophosphatase family enzyme
VSDLDLRLDVAIRTTLSTHYPDVSVLSEELGWLYPADLAPAAWVAVIDPVDGTDSLVERRDSWWTSVGLLEEGVPRAGVIYQPTTGTTHDSMAPRGSRNMTQIVGLSPDQIETDETLVLRRRLEEDHFSILPIPHAVEKVAAVLEGRCDACVYLPSEKSPGWHSWDLAACLAVADASHVVLRAVDGTMIRLNDLDAYQRVPWICAGDLASWDHIRAAVTA